MQSLSNPLQASFQSSADGGDSFLREFNAFQATVIGDLPIDSGRFDANSFSERNEYKMKNAKPIISVANELDAVDSADQLDEFTDLDEDSLEPLPPDNVDDLDDFSSHVPPAFVAGNRQLFDGSDQKVPGLQIPYVHNSDSDLELVNPQKVIPSALEDPIETYDAVVAQMTSAGVEWVPPDQKTKKISHVRWIAPEVEESYTVEPVTIASDTAPRTTATEKTAPKKTDSRNTSTPSPTSINSTASAPKSITTTTVRESPPPRQVRTGLENIKSAEAKLLVLTSGIKSGKNAVTIGKKTIASDNNRSAYADTETSKLRNQLMQEQATRKQQEEYIQQLQKYYDNLLAKHAAAEQTIDHMRFRVKVGPSESDNQFQETPESRAGSRYSSRNQLPSTPIYSTGLLKRSKLLSASADVFNRPPQQLVHQSLSSLATGQTSRRQTSLSRDALPQKIIPIDHPAQTVHLSASVGQISSLQNPTLSNDKLYDQTQPPKLAPDVANSYREQELTPYGKPHYQSSFSCERRSPSPTALSRQNGLSGGGTGSGSTPSLAKLADVDLNAARSLEEQLHVTLATIDERVVALENVAAKGQLSPRQRDEMVAELTKELNEVKRKYHAGQYLWSTIFANAFDVNADLERRLSDLERRLQSALERQSQGLNSLDETTAVKQHHERPMSSDSAVFSGTLGSSSQVHLSPILNTVGFKAPSSASRESAETHFQRLLTRYNELKKCPWHTSIVKDLESLMQRMLQLSERYSSQSSVIFQAKDLRQMFELDYETNRLNNQLGKTLTDGGVTNHFSCSQPDLEQDAQSENSVNRAYSTSKTIILTPDSGLATPPAVNSAFGARKLGAQYEQQGRRNSFSQHFSGQETAVQARSIKYLQTHSIDTNATDRGIESSSEVPYLSSDNQYLRANNRNSDLPEEVMHLEEDIKELRQGIARLTHLSSLSPSPSPKSVKTRGNKQAICRTSDRSSPCQFVEAGGIRPSPASGRKYPQQSYPTKRVFGPATRPSTSRQANYSDSSSSSGREVGRPGASGKQVFAGDGDLSTDSSEMHVVGSGLRPNCSVLYPKSATLDHTRPAVRTCQQQQQQQYLRYHKQAVSGTSNHGRRDPSGNSISHNSIRPIKRKSRTSASGPDWIGSMPSLEVEDRGCEVVRLKKKTGKSRNPRSQSSTGGEHRHRTYLLQTHPNQPYEQAPCDSCFGSGLRLNEPTENGYSTLPISHGRTRSDPHTMPSRVIYEYSQPSIPVMSSVRLPVKTLQDDVWGERVYEVHEFEEQGTPSPSEFRTYKSLGHQPTFRQGLRDRKGADRQFRVVPLLPSNSSLIPNDYYHDTNHSKILPSNRNSRSGYHKYENDAGDDDTDSSSSQGYHNRIAAVAPSYGRPRRPTSLCRQMSDSTDDVDAYATAKSVTQMAQRLHSKLASVHVPSTRKKRYCDPPQ